MEANAQQAAEAASGPPLNVSILVDSSSTIPCYGTGRTPAITKLTTLAQEEINKQGGIHGRPVQIQVLDGSGQAEFAIANVKKSLADPQLLGMIGISNDYLGRTVFGQLKGLISERKVPFITSVTDRSMYDAFGHVFSTEPSRSEEGLPLIAEFIKFLNVSHVGFIGQEGSSASREAGSGLLARLGFDNLIWDHRIKMKGFRLDPESTKEAIELVIKPVEGKNGKVQPTSMIVVDLDGAQAAELISALQAAKQAPAIFLTGEIDDIPTSVLEVYRNAIYQLAWDRPPEAQNNRIIQLVGDEKPDQGVFAGRVSLERLPEVINNRINGLVGEDQKRQWIFAGRKRHDSPGWQSGFCKERPTLESPNPLNPENLRAIEVGSQYADLLRLITVAARTAGPTTKIDEQHAAIVREMRSTFADGKGAFKGRLRNWSFDVQHRTATRKPFIVILPQGLGRKQLAPVQFARAHGRKLRRIDTLYLDIDMVRAHSINDNTKSYLADFYIAMRGGKQATIEDVDFSNAYLDPRTGGRQLTIQTLHEGGPSDVYPETMRIYRVSGRFLFDPNLANYPFDSQHFTIDIRPKTGNNPFIVQPPPLRLRDKELSTDGWILQRQYVGYAADFIPVVDAFTHSPSIVPFYTASFVWKMKRETTDYFLRVVVPLAFILIVAYLSIFIPQSHLEAIVTIQITALLSAVALYLSLPKLEADTATISDRIFVFDYMMVSFMIVISILRINRRIAKRKWLDGVLSFIHIVIIPVVVLVMVFSVYQVSILQA
ncbi:MAG: ABC transporter substrate-binding protein [Hyphomicrobiaceae bacterium]